ncbi:hypothetical protein C8R46DRAFT_1226152 [Mycena filopes]|nr:hypothetical protein C8R46DRAFT_1226152 [Mycena filopes]
MSAGTNSVLDPTLLAGSRAPLAGQLPARRLAAITLSCQSREEHTCGERGDNRSLTRGGASNVRCFSLGTDGYGCTVHFYWPGRGFQLLGICILTATAHRLSNDKSSATILLRGTFTPASALNTHSAFSVSSSAMQIQQDPQAQPEQITAILGFSVEPLAEFATLRMN